MSKKVTYIFKIDGSYGSVNYYKSNMPMNPDAMPAPTATGITELSYVDTSIQEVMNYVRFSTIRNGIEKISAEIKVDLSQYKKIYYLGNMSNPLRVNVYREIVESLGLEMIDIAWSDVSSIPTDCKLIIAPDMSITDGYFKNSYLTILQQKFDAGVPVLISVYSGSVGSLPTTFPSYLGIGVSFADISSASSINIVSNNLLPFPFSDAQANLIIRESSYYMPSLSGVTANAEIFARHGSVCAGAVLLKDAINKAGKPSPANVAFAGFAHTKPTSQLLNTQGKELLKAVIQRVMR